ncbi:uncharacterized protein LOC111908794 [Lactuca sativa]|uniref:Uncharacterized protein n=1 Tax=Lactuca sativa TaxID=4236 RepID=A0A9R1V681_LACSA|nr:uncharacterized protein LOC111908794 [Lactuca sativa]KAJ0200962.1 hypothetical protein LSAT_V11C600339660 [Lactuca sativa]
MASTDVQRHSRRSKSFTFSDSISDDSSVTTPIPSTPIRYLGIPFSWEQFPGIPKKNTYKKSNLTQHLLPLPPSSHAPHQSPTMKKSSSSQNFRKDPFFAAFIECSKDKEFEVNGLRKSSKLPSVDRSGFVVSMYSSCKRTCAVSESIVFRRRSSTCYL